MIASEIQDGLNGQINEEYCSWYFYRSAADYCREKNLTGISSWLRGQANKKMNQADRLADFVLERRGHVEARPIDSKNGHWDTLLGIFDAALEHERHLAQTVTELMSISLRNGDHATHDLLEKFASDQMHAESSVELARDRLKMVGDAPAGLFMFDRDMA